MKLIKYLIRLYLRLVGFRPIANESQFAFWRGFIVMVSNNGSRIEFRHKRKMMKIISPIPFNENQALFCHFRKSQYLLWYHEKELIMISFINGLIFRHHYRASSCIMRIREHGNGVVLLCADATPNNYDVFKVLDSHIRVLNYFDVLYLDFQKPQALVVLPPNSFNEWILV